MAKSPAKKVLFTSHTANFQKFNRPFMRMLKEQGYTVHYASAGEEEVFDADEHFTVPFERSPFKPGNIKAYFALKKVIDREKYDLIHTHTPMGSVVTRLAARAARKRGTRVIYTAHGFHFFKGAPLLNWIVYYPIEKFMARHTDTLITINNEDYERATAKFKTDVKYVPGVGVDEGRFEPRLTKAERNKLRASLGIKPDDFVMIYPAELSKRKRQIWLINTVSELLHENSNIHLLLPGGDSLDGACQRLAQSFELEGQVHFLGYRNDIPQLMMASDLSVSSSSQEGLPVNILEALVAKLPVIATDSRGHADLVQTDKNGYIVGIDNDSMFAERIEHLYGDVEQRLNMARRSYELLEGYRLNDIKPKMSTIYSQKRSKDTVIHLLASNKYSGAESVAVDIINNTTSGIDSYYASPDGGIADILKQKQVRHIVLKSFSYSGIRKVIKKYKPAIIHAHDFKASILASYFSRNIKVISHIHQNPAWIHGINHRSLLYVMRSRKFAKVVVVTKAMLTSYIFNHIRKDRLIVLHNSIDVEYIKKRASEPHDEEYDLIFCGRLEDVKRPVDFLRVVKYLKKGQEDIRAVLVGDGTLRKDCEDYVVKHNLVNNVRFVGFQENPYKFMKNSKYLLLTSRDEGFGLVVVEAATLGVVPISYDLPAVRELLVEDSFFAKSETEMAYLIANGDRSNDVRKIQAAQIAKLLTLNGHNRESVPTLYEDML